MFHSKIFHRSPISAWGCFKDNGGFGTKKYITIGIAAVLAIATALTALLLRPAVQPPSGQNADHALSAAIETPSLLQTLTGDRDFSAEAVSVGGARQKLTDASDEPVYTSDNVPAVTGLHRNGDSSDTLSLSWDGIAGIHGYRVYWRSSDREGAEYTLFSTVITNGLEIRNLSAGDKYDFRVAAYITDDGGAHEGEAAEAQFATIPTAADGFHVVDETKDATSLAWSQNEHADGYLMERRYNGEWTEYQTFDRDTAAFTDTGLTGGKGYFYRIYPFREDSDGRMLGEPAIVRTVAGLIGPENNGSASKLGRVSLDFKKNPYADGYAIYYSKDKESWELLTETEKTHYSTSRLENGVTYFFRIYSYQDFNTIRITGGYTELEFVADTEIYGKTVGNTYVEVSLTDQHMWYIVDGDVYLESDCVTGNYGSADTPKGFFAVNGGKTSPCTLKGDDYVSYVTYWMPFIGGGWGLHDATWRSKFGGSIYKGDGSHGCVNLPFDIAKKMYAKIEVGTPVIVY